MRGITFVLLRPAVFETMARLMLWRRLPGGVAARVPATVPLRCQVVGNGEIRKET